MTIMRVTLALCIIGVWATALPSIDRSEGAAVWVGEIDAPDIREAVAIARKVYPHLVRVPCGTFFMDLPRDFWASGVTVQGSGSCTRAIVPQEQYGI